MSRSIVDLVGDTPVVTLGGFDSANRGTVLIKLEGENPGGSSKDRIALSMIQHAQSTGELTAGARIIEATSGNTGIGLALIGAAYGHPVTLVVSSVVSAEKRALLTAFGATLVDADWEAPPGSPGNARTIAAEIAAAEPGSWQPSQYLNPHNPGAHYRTTGPEIWKQTNEAVTHLVASIGTGGTISGTSRYLKEVSAGRVRVVGADPVGSSYAGGQAGTVIVDGVGSRWTPDAWPQTYSPELVDEVITVSDNRVYGTLRELAKHHGLLFGPSGALAVAAAIDVAGQAGPESVVVVIAPDRGANYISKTFNDDWLAAQGIRL